ncbi:Prolyl tripeptidyl peptidase precursor [Gemmata obscuriglobus]|uniref:S9 family peptidase n=1 Tax=Gemmata obscuriglobus TaxID=114 RepID=A0A2Z3HJ33_9BACT|nr:S9 family peptidase [Gemmata obscuriglobus]AWM41834.1 S9 family peptidase [Gemmata obscuriglobus]QEG32200.1 Prolyl tripeptidyl peptidase precursor [Gemmata obscuriglobus]VTS11553.1 peptidase s9 : Prolyl oligopeptidase family protein OS=Candidatus Chloracidobacterium thermophilum GN=YS_M60-F11.201 PE=4 SV=1: PD40: PD40: PD40: PD40: Peptidase_S9 [Gemmata obscuriglobus UQM 2246]
MRFRLLLTAAVLIAAPLALPAADKRPMKVQDLFAFKRVASPQISPDGKAVVYQVTTVDLGANKSSTALWLAATDGKTEPKQITDPKGKKDMNPRWSPDGTRVLFESTRSGTPQLWVLTVGEEPKPVTSISTGASNGTWAPDGKSVAFVSTVYPEFSEKPFPESDKLNKEKDEEIEKSPVKAKTFTKLFYRHWDDYVGDKRQHLFVCNLDGTDTRDVTPGDRDANPTSSTFSSGDDFTFSPDGKYLVFTAVPDKDESWSTNYDICRVSVTNTSTKWECLTKDNKAADGGPKFSPDGKKLAWRAQKQAGYEADKWDVLVADAKPDGTLVGKPRSMLGFDDVSANEFCWSGNEWLLFTADRKGFTALHKTTLAIDKGNIGWNPGRTGAVAGVSSDKTGERIAFTKAQMDHPAEVFSEFQGDLSGVIGNNISRANDKLLAELDLPRPESEEVPVEGGVKMQMWVLKPPGFDASKKWPVAYLVHGGPQGAWEDSWSFRWNPQAWAAQGYVVVMPNPRGSTGFGQKFVDEITGDWGGKCYRDLMAGLDYVEKLPYVDKDRIGSAGGSFGGYMMNWFAVNDAAKRFKCLITHCSVWNFESMWGTTDELWFDEWEHGGLPWEKPGKYAEFSPHKKAGNMAKAKTPMLIIHNDLDFRCPIGQGHELFSALQRQGVPSRFVNFPDEGHWVLKPKNSEHWHKEVFAWLKKYVPPGPK